MRIVVHFHPFFKHPQGVSMAQQKFVPLSPEDRNKNHDKTVIGKATCEICKIKGLNVLKDGPGTMRGKLAQHRLPTDILRLCDGSNAPAILI